MTMAQVGSVALLLLSSAAPCWSQTATERTVVVNGHTMRVKVGGMERAGTTPTVVFEAAFGERLDTWNSIFDTVTSFAPAIAYDRAGIGGSVYDGHAPTPDHVARNLNTLLTAIGAKPPYILVGHSWGGLLVRMFTALYGPAVAGIVFEDPTDLRPLAEEVTYYREQGYVGQAMVDRKAALLSFRTLTEGAKVLIATVQGDFKDFRDLPPLPDVPVAMLMSAHFDPVSWKGSPCAPKACEEVLVRWRIHWLREPVSGVTNATLTVATAVGHFMHVEDPELVVGAIRRVVSASQRRIP